MSRIGKIPIPIPGGVKVSVRNATVEVEGPKGKLAWTHRPEVTVQVDEASKAVVVGRKNDDRGSRAFHGLTRSLIANMVKGVSKGYQLDMELYGVGFGVQMQGTKFSMTCGYSHPVVIDLPAGVVIEVKTPQSRGDSDPAKFSVSGIDKQKVGEIAAQIYRSCKPEPYKGKGVRYAGQQIRRKLGKAFAGAGG